MNKLVFSSEELEVLKRVLFNQRDFYVLCESGISDIRIALYVCAAVKKYTLSTVFVMIDCAVSDERIICDCIINKIADFCCGFEVASDDF